LTPRGREEFPAPAEEAHAQIIPARRGDVKLFAS